MLLISCLFDAMLLLRFDAAYMLTPSLIRRFAAGYLCH